MAENGREILEQSKPSVDIDSRVRNLRDRQNEERQRKLEEIKAQALAAQRFKEQKEQERRKRMEDMRQRDDMRRMQVEERKKAINDAERDRLEFIIKRNSVREQRLESKKKNERSNVVFAFGSSTPRMLEPSDMAVSFWGTRRATSIQNIVSSTNSSSSLTRRQSERDLDVGNKKRATSATGLERTAENNGSVVPAGCVSGYLGRRRTDLVPTVPTRDPSSFHSSRKSLNHSPASSRPSSSLSQQSTNSVTSSASVRHRLTSAPRKPRPVSIAVTGISNDLAKPPLPRARKVTGKPSEKSDKVGPAKAKVKSPVDGMQKVVKNAGRMDETQQKPPDTAPIIAKVVEQNSIENGQREEIVLDASADMKDDPLKNDVPDSKQSDIDLGYKSKPADELDVVGGDTEEKILKETSEKELKPVPKAESPEAETQEKKEETKAEKLTQVVTASPVPDTNIVSNDDNNDNSVNNDSSVNEMTASMTKMRITTEEEAKAALAERRRLIREEAERQAEMERLRIEAEAKAEIERQQREEEQIRQLIELQRQTEQERLQEAIREAQKREEEEKLRREEEQRLKILKEESDRKAKEEAEKRKAELQERLKNEEKEREARRKRVEAIMLRTRGKNNANSQQSTDDKNNENKSDENQDNDSKLNGTKIVDKQENGTTNSSKDADIVDNIISSEIVKNANTVTIEKMNSSDSINSNNSWRGSQQYDALM